MSGRQILLLALLSVLGLFLSLGLGQSRVSTPDHSDAQTVASSSAGEPAGANRCKVCHAAEVEGYARSAMAHALRRAGQETSGTVTTPNGKITMYSSPTGSWQRLETAGDTSKYHIDYVIGSGNHASGYLIDIAGHLFQSPIAFYKSRNAYDLAPGYEKMQDPDFTRPVAEGCVFCHAGSAIHVSGTDNVYRSPVFPAEGITCERCHGPTGKHLADPRAGRIVNPAKLEPGARDSVCEQCHLMGVARVPNPGKEFRDFQPGQRLEGTFTTYHDVLPPGTPAGTFKVISHVEQLAMSTCARNSQGRLWCGTCHDPHNKPAQPAQYYRSRCLTCHTARFSAEHPGTDSNCIGCHMPRRDAQDGGHTAFTDHRIQRRPEEQTNHPPDGDIAAWREPPPDLQKRNLGIGYVSAGLQRKSADLLVRGYRLLTEVQEQFSTDPDVFTSMGTALLIGKQPTEAEFAFEHALSLRPHSAVAETNAAAAQQQAGDINGTIVHLERAVAIDPMHLPAMSALIQIYQEQGKAEKARELSAKVRRIMDEQPAQGKYGSALGRSTSAASSPRTAGAVFKNLKVLNDIPSDQLIPSMRFIASSLGVECSFCHSEGHFEDDGKKAKQTARRMMQMVFATNQNRFDGTREVTCYTCHRGAATPVAVPSVAGESAPPHEADAISLKSVKLPSDLPTADQLIDSFIRTLGGADAIEKITDRAEMGSGQIDGKSIPVELFNKGPDKQVFIQHTPAGDRVTALDGNSGWMIVPGRPLRDLSGSDLDAARLDADLQFALHIKNAFPELRVEYPETVDGREAYVLVGTREGRSSWKFFFDAQSRLLVRLVRYAESPLGLDPTQIDYRDYRAVDDVQVPFGWTISRPGSRSTIQISEIQQNVPMDDQKFRKPSVKAEKGSKAALSR
jgi:photosynthetic reaction center cytochrome c subunit